MVRCSISASPPSNWPIPIAGLPSARTGRWTCALTGSGGETAADLVNTLPEAELAEILFRFGEERQARRIVKAIIRNRPQNSTRQLAETIAAAVGFSEGARSRMHPATRTFQALRIAVNGELEELETALPALMECLEAGGGWQ